MCILTQLIKIHSIGLMDWEATDRAMQQTYKIDRLERRFNPELKKFNHVFKHPSTTPQS
jgi:hypothetical protein